MAICASVEKLLREATGIRRARVYQIFAVGGCTRSIKICFCQKYDSQQIFVLKTNS